MQIVINIVSIFNKMFKLLFCIEVFQENLEQKTTGYPWLTLLIK